MQPVDKLRLNWRFPLQQMLENIEKKLCALLPAEQSHQIIFRGKNGPALSFLSSLKYC